MISEHVRRRGDITEMGDHFLKKLVVGCLENDSTLRPDTKDIKNVLERHKFEAEWIVLQSSGFETDDEVTIENAECQSSLNYKLKVSLIVLLQKTSILPLWRVYWFEVPHPQEIPV